MVRSVAVIPARTEFSSLRSVPSGGRRVICMSRCFCRPHKLLRRATALSLTREWSRLLSEHLSKYSLTVSPAFCACVCRMSFSSLVRRMWISDVTPCDRFGRGIAFCPFCGVSGRSPERDAQPILRVAERRIGEVVVGHAKPRRGFVSTSAYLAVLLNDSGFPAIVLTLSYYTYAVN
jgi:hypothetical protein